jgi:transcription elongation GreA/GreB family factor
MPENEAKAIRLIEYLTRVASLRAKIIRDVADYSLTLWLHEIPREKGCFTRAWGLDEEYDQDIWIEIQTSHEPELPSIPELCRDWVNRNTLRETNDFPELLNEITRQVENPDWEEGTDQPQLINQTASLLAHPEVQKAWDVFVEQKWMPWAEEHQKWKLVHKVYSALFAIHQEQLRLGEEYELVLGIGLLTWQTHSNQRIRRHLVVANALLEFEARLGKFTIRPNPDGANLRPELDMLDIEEQPAQAEEAAKNGLNEAADDPWNQSCIEGILRALAHSINPDGEYHDRLEAEKPQYSVKPTVECAPALILRKHSVKGLSEILKRIKKRIEDGETIPPEFEDISEIQKSDREVSLEPDGDSDAQRDVEIYFPKPSNEEQRRIIEKTRSASGVLVQGPPGTGKSHTIANLVCHLLATGQRTLITAKTPRALKVLERLLPEEMRPLCINLLGSGLEEKRSLEASVRAILQKNEQWKEDYAQSEIQKREEALYRLRQEKAEIEKRLRAIRESETHPQSIADGTYRGTAAQIAQAVVKDENTYGWFTDTVPFNSEFPLSEAELSGLLKGLRTLTHEKRKELSLSWPDSFPSVELFESLVESERKATDQEKKTSTNVDQDVLQRLSCLHEERIRSIQESLTKLRNDVIMLRSLPYAWIPDALRNISFGNDAVWQELQKASEQIISNIDKIFQTADENSVALPYDRDPKAVLVDAETLKEHLINGGKLGWGPFRPKVVKSVIYIIKNVKLNDCFCNGLDHVSLLVDVLRVQTELERGWGFWIGRTERAKGPYSLQFREFESLTKALNETLSITNIINQCKELLVQLGNFGMQAYYEESRLETLIQTCIHLVARIHKAKIEDEIKQVEAPVAALTAKTNAHPVANGLLEATRSRNVDAFARCCAKIEKLRKEKQTALWIQKTFKRLSEAVPRLAGNLEGNPTDKCWDEQFKQMSAAWRWAQARYWLQDYVRKEDAPGLDKRVQQIEDEIGKTISHIASLRAWSFCFGRMEEDHRRNMEAWQQEMRKLGKGTGKHAPRHRREAQKHLNKCREAVPAWVMPLHRVWDTVDPAPGMFDMIVVDEASQCGLEALPLFYLGKKILIVGDDKQISPDAVGVPRDAVHRLMEEYLYDFQFKASFDVESSLFDHGKLRYGMRSIALQEHFRCMPEIIRFSNDLCYSDTPLIPLRQYGADRLVPIRHVHLPNGYREGSHSRVINRPEAEAIADKIVELCQDEKYADKTIGVVVLQGDAQAGLIENELLKRLGAEEMEKRRLVCGNPYSFQGDERDIMLLSMVAAPNERIGPLAMSADERRFNVAASRARDQMWLFHSVTREDLSASCLRRRLLEFFEGTKIQPITGINLEELEKSAQQTNRSIVKAPDPFDSWFEVDVALKIARKGYHVIPQFAIAGKFIDLVIEGGQARLAVECDGDKFHGAEQYEHDTQRQRMLERCGWVFFHIRASAFYFYANKENSLNNLWTMLEERGIQPHREEKPAPEEKNSDFRKQEQNDNKPETDSGEEDSESIGGYATKTECAEIGDTVVYVYDESPDSERQVMITHDSSNPDWGTINFRTPIAQALLGTRAGERVEAKLPRGIKILHIKEIRKESL